MKIYPWLALIIWAWPASCSQPNEDTALLDQPTATITVDINLPSSEERDPESRWHPISSYYGQQQESCCTRKCAWTTGAIIGGTTLTALVAGGFYWVFFH